MLLVSAQFGGAVAAAAQDPADVALAYLRARAAAVMASDARQAEALVDPSRPDLRAFVARTLIDLAAQRRTLGALGARSQVFINGIDATPTGWTVHATDAYWFDRANAAWAADGEGKFAILTSPTLTAAVAFTHELRIDRGVLRAALTGDAHKYFGDRSPDYKRPDGGMASVVPGLSRSGKLARPDHRPLGYTLNPSNMRAWASWYWGPNDSNYHPSYDNYNASGGDCTNFVSQVLNFGNMPMEVDTIPNKEFGCWNCWWYSNGAGSYPHSGTPWRYVPSHMTYLVNSGRGMWETGPDRIGVGDPIYFDWQSDGTFDHAVVVTGISGTNERLVAGHLTNMFDYPYSSISGGTRKFIYTFLTGTP